jgi:hypothetical protein
MHAPDSSVLGTDYAIEDDSTFTACGVEDCWPTVERVRGRGMQPEKVHPLPKTREVSGKTFQAHLREAGYTATCRRHGSICQR